MTRDGRLWPWAVGLVLGVTMAGNIWVMRLAGADDSFAIEPDYYQKAVDWDSTMAQSRRNSALGWQLDARLGLPVDGVAPLVVSLLAADGTPLDGAGIRVEATHNARAAEIHSPQLRPAGAGQYRADLVSARPGRWELRFDVRRGDAHFTTTVRLDTSRGVASP